MNNVVNAADITCPDCSAIGPCRNTVRSHNGRSRMARDLTRANELAEQLGFEDGLPDLGELEMMATLGHDEDKPIAAELIALCDRLGTYR